MKRIEWLDDLKGLAITLIVAGHVVATLENMVTGNVQLRLHAVFDAIYLFHVPLFFVIAGLTFSAKDSFGTFAKKKFLRLMAPYYVWGFLSAAAYVLMGQGMASGIQAMSTTSSFADKTLHGAWWVPFVSILHAGTWPDGKGFCFNGVLWFLPVMFVSELAFYWVARLCHTRARAFCAFSILAFALIWLYPLIYGIKFSSVSIRYFPFNIMALIRYLPFLALGYWFSCQFLREKSDADKGDGIFAVVGFALLVYFCLASVLPIARKSSAFWVKWFVQALPPIAALLVLSKCKALRWFGFLAPMTLGIMLFHKFPLVIFQVALGRAHFFQSALCQRFPTASAMALSVLLTAVLTLLCHFISKVIVRYLPWSLGSRSASPA